MAIGSVREKGDIVDVEGTRKAMQMLMLMSITQSHDVKSFKKTEK